jgi:hypothetical protein
MDIPEKLAILGTQDARRRQTQHNMCQTPLHASNVNKTQAHHKQPEAKNDSNIVFMWKS